MHKLISEQPERQGGVSKETAQQFYLHRQSSGSDCKKPNRVDDERVETKATLKKRIVSTALGRFSTFKNRFDMQIVEVLKSDCRLVDIGINLAKPPTNATIYIIFQCWRRSDYSPGLVWA